MVKKVLIIGLDGGTWKILKPMIEKGHMPHLRSLVENGASGILKSTEPPVTAPAWTSFLTGVKPEKHGIFEFNNYMPGTYSTYFVNGSHISYKTIWDILSESGKKVISINVPMTYPPKPVNGLLISCMLTPSTDVTFTYPPELRDEIFNIVSEYKIITTGKVYCLSGLNKFIDELIDTEQRRIKVAKHLMQNSDCDIEMVHIQSTDVIQHYLFHILDKNHPLHDSRGIERVYEFYSEIDKALGELTGLFPDSLKILMSDHGFKSVNKMVNLNAILSKKGFLQVKENKKFLSNVTKMASKLVKYDRLNIIRWVLGKQRRKIFEHVKDLLIDYTKTTAFSINGWVYGNIYINLEGREKHGIVKKEDYNKVRDIIIKELEKITDPATGEKIFTILKKEDIFNNTKHMHASDITVLPKGPYEFTGSMYFREKEFILNNKIRREHTGSHDRDGIVIFTDSKVKKTTITAHIVDILPTILWYAGLPVPEYIDGKVLTEVFEDEFVRENPVQFIQASEKSTSSSISESDSQEIKDRLKSLGYL